MFRQVVDKRFSERSTVAGDRHGQVQNDRFAFLGVGSQPVAARDRRQIKRDPRLPANDPVIILGTKGQGHLPFGAGLRKGHHIIARPLRRIAKNDPGRRIWAHDHIPVAPPRTVNCQTARTGHCQILRGGCWIDDIGSHGLGHILRDAKRTQFPV